MALQLIEGFDNLPAGGMLLKGWSSSIAFTSGRFGGQATTRTANGTIVTKPITGAATLVGGFAFQVTASPGTNNALLGFVSGATNVCRTFFNASSQITVQNNGGSVIATGTTVINPNVWYYLEVKLFVNGASGTVEVHLNGVTEIASTVGNFGSSNPNAFGWAAPASNTLVDDFYVLDTSGSANTNFLGDVQVSTLEPTGAGSHTQWTPLSGANYTQVNETIADGDTSYNSDSNIGDLDSFPTGGVNVGATVFGAQVNLYARKDNTGLRQIAPLVRQAGSDFAGTTVTLASSYQFFTQIYNQDPTNSNWTAATLNADEFGYKLVA